MSTKTSLTSRFLNKTAGKLLLLGAVSLALLPPAHAAPLPTLEEVKSKSEQKSEVAPSPNDPLHMVVSLDEQKLSVYRGANLVEVTPISSGKKGHSTPTGVFSILEKRKRHFSNLYDNAPMPYMQRLTWSGIALHEGRLPGYPASHGCVRLPREFAKNLYSQTSRGHHVVVTKELVKPTPIRHRGLIQPGDYRTTVASLAESESVPQPLRGALDDSSTANAAAQLQIPENPHFDKPLRMIVTLDSKHQHARTLQKLLNEMGYNAGPVDGVIGRKTRAAMRLYQEEADLPISDDLTPAFLNHLYSEVGYENVPNATIRVRRKFRDIYQAPVFVKDPEADIGTHVFTALDFEQGDLSVDWIALPAEGERGGRPEKVLDRLVMPKDVRERLSKMLTPGSSLIMTDRSFARNTGLGTDFVVVTR